MQLQGEVRAGLKAGPSLGMLATFRGLIHKQGPSALFRGIAPAAIRQLVLAGGTAALYGPSCDIVSIWLREQNSSKKAPFWAKLLTGMGCAAIAQAVASPIDVVKIRMQADARLQKKASLLNQGVTSRYKSIPDAFLTIFREEGGVKAFYRGAISNMQRAAITNGVWIASYDQTREHLIPVTGNNLTATLIASQVSNVVCLVVSSPWDIIRTRMMNHEHAGGYRNAFECLTQTVRTEGFMALYKGFIPAMARGALWGAVFFTLFESAT